MLTTKLGSSISSKNLYNCSPEDGYVFESKNTSGEKFDTNNPKYQSDLVAISNSSSCQYRSLDCDGITSPSWDNLACVIPAIYINLDNFIKLMEISKTFEIFPDIKNKGCFPSIVFGMFPKEIEDKEQRFEIYEKIRKNDSSVKYLGKQKGFNTPHFLSKYYNYEYSPCFRDGYRYTSKPMDKYDINGQIVLFDDFERTYKILQPLIMRIANWEQLPKSINPNGDGSAKYLIVIPNELIFNSLNKTIDDYHNMVESGNFVTVEQYDEVYKYLNNEFLDAVFNIKIPFTIERRTLIEKMINSYNRATPFESTGVVDRAIDGINNRLEELEKLGVSITARVDDLSMVAANERRSREIEQMSKEYDLYIRKLANLQGGLDMKEYSVETYIYLLEELTGCKYT